MPQSAGYGEAEILRIARFLGCLVARSEVAALLGRLDDTPMCFVPRDTDAITTLSGDTT
jgi:hypothetical protein